MRSRQKGELKRAEKRASLATTARRLNRRAGSARLPSFFLVTDERRQADPTPAVIALPRGAGVIFRHYGDPLRARRAQDLARLCRARGLVLLIAGDAALAARVRAQGVHLPEAQTLRVRSLRRMRRTWLITVSAHGEAALRKTAGSGADAVFLAPVFATASHPGRKPLGVLRFAALARHASVPVYALGGIDAENAKRLVGAGAAGLGALGALLP